MSAVCGSSPARIAAFSLTCCATGAALSTSGCAFSWAVPISGPAFSFTVSARPAAFWPGPFSPGLPFCIFSLAPVTLSLASLALPTTLSLTSATFSLADATERFATFFGLIFSSRASMSSPSLARVRLDVAL